jgi:hypothetical protein
MNKGIQYIKAKRPSNQFDEKIKIDLKHESPDKLAVEFLSVTSFCWIGYYKWYFKDEFLNVFEFLEGEKIF